MLSPPRLGFPQTPAPGLPLSPRYHDILDTMEEYGIEPNATLHHFVHPQVRSTGRARSSAAPLSQPPRGVRHAKS